ncbi:hypothetical protein [Nocardioides sp. GXZ039]|uniref:hypothetical protein n=1 Tax=Nocardioides sp. GXZ039 TaxID=3136018 RepID=UPI0030F44F6E
MSRYVDYRPPSPSGAPVGRCIVLPGRQYTPDGPLLFFAAQAALAHGWEVRQVWWQAEARETADDVDEIAWVGDQLRAAIADSDGRVLVVAKSLGTLAAPTAAELGVEAAWLTPILTDPQISRALSTYPAAQFTLIGQQDPWLDRSVFDALPGRTVLVEGDHILGVPGDVVGMVDAHREFVHAFDDWLSTLA